MPTIVVFPDVPALVIAYLQQYFPAATVVGMNVPEGWEWDDLLIVVVDTGGPGEKAVILDESYITVTVSHPDAAEASDTARVVHGLLKNLPYSNTAVRWVESVQRPTFEADDKEEAPAYSMTVAVTSRATTQQVTT